MSGAITVYQGLVVAAGAAAPVTPTVTPTATSMKVYQGVIVSPGLAPATTPTPTPAHASVYQGLVITDGTLVAPATSSTPASEKLTTITASGTAQTISFPVSGNAAYDITQTANCVLTLTGGTAGQYQTITLILRQDSTAGWSATLPSGIRWPDGVAPVVNTQSGRIDVFNLSTPDAGATVFGSF